jgi:hypothetical protein
MPVLVLTTRLGVLEQYDQIIHIQKLKKWLLQHWRGEKEIIYLPSNENAYQGPTLEKHMRLISFTLT